MEEIYKIINGFENYSVSNFGNVRNDKTKRIFKAGINSRGYKRVKLFGKMINIHRLVAKTFILNPDNKKCVDHIDCDKTNNRIENLRDADATWNNTNKKIQSNNSSGIKGISFYPKFNRIHAQIQVHGKKIHKTFVPISDENLTLAKQWLNEQRNNLHGEYANHG